MAFKLNGIIMRMCRQSKHLSSNNKRMTRRLLNADEAFKITPADQVQVQKLQAGAKLSGGVHNLPPKLPKRKDLCRLLGLNEQDVDLMIVPEVKVAQKSAVTVPQMHYICIISQHLFT